MEMPNIEPNPSDFRGGGAAVYGTTEGLKWLLDRGIDLDTALRLEFGDGSTNVGETGVEVVTNGTAESAAHLRELMEDDNDERFARAIREADTGSHSDVIEMMRESKARVVDDPSTNSGPDDKDREEE